MTSESCEPCFADLLHVTGLGQNSLGVGGGGQQLPPHQPETSSSSGNEHSSSSGSGSGSRPVAAATTGSDILDTSTHELKLEKSNILMLGPTGSGNFIIIPYLLLLLLLSSSNISIIILEFLSIVIVDR